MKQKKSTSVVVPLLLILAGIFCYLTIKNNWNFEMASYSIFIFASIYIFIFEKTLPLKQEWKPKKDTIWTDIQHFIFSVAIVDSLGKMVALFVVVYLQEHYFESHKKISKSNSADVDTYVNNLFSCFPPTPYYTSWIFEDTNQNG